ncbi:cytochrome c oxidase subunit I [Candidatus Poribacteria bacterium]|nr:cytochrome c oxidase subunit I [Candidatus Poribacteria bacterium]
MMSETGHAEPTSFFRRYIFSTDHKVIGKQYLFLGMVMALLGGLMAYVMRWQLAWPGSQVPGAALLSEPAVVDGVVTPPFYNALVTMHGTIMVFFVAMPILLGAFGNYLVPLMIGARDMAFPRLNMLSFWILFTASSVMMISFFVPGGAAAGGWTAYPPLSARPLLSGVNWGMNLWILGLALEFSAFLLGGVNLLTTVVTMRAPGMTMWRLPMMVWMQLTAAIIFMLSVGPTIAGAILLLLDRVVGTGFFVPQQGGDPLLWQHLFWFFGHPEVYVILLPGIGVLAEVLPAFSRKPIFAYKMILYSIFVAGVLSFLVWAHHMFVSGMNPTLVMPFSVATILISVPFTIVIFALIATLWGGSIQLPTAMLYALGTLTMFIIGGITGIFNGSAPVDIYIHDTYFVVAHFHYTLFPTVLLGGLAGFYFWFPKMFGRMLNETLGKIHFWLTLISFNAVFLPMFALGIGGHVRRIYDPSTYDLLKPLHGITTFVTIATVCLLLSQIPFLINIVVSLTRGERAAANPWRANTLEWSTASPPPHENFVGDPVVMRGPYEYSVPGADQDWLPQMQDADTATTR